MKHQAEKHVEPAYVEPMVVCDECGKTIGTESGAINYWTGLGVLGHPSLTNNDICGEQHWACSFECWWKIAQDCLKFAHDTMVALHAELPDSVHNSKAKEILNGQK